MNINKVFRIYRKIKKRVMFDYPFPILVFFRNEDELLSWFSCPDLDGINFYAVIEPELNAILIPLFFTYPDADGADTFIKLSEEKIAFILLHELGHVYYYNKYENKSKYNDEALCSRYARRWVKKMKRESLIK